MKRGLSYIVMAVFCGLCFSSCAKDELAAKATDSSNERRQAHCLSAMQQQPNCFCNVRQAF